MPSVLLVSAGCLERGAWAASSGMAAPIRLADVAMRKSLRVCDISPLRLSATFSGLNIGREEIYSRLRR